MIISIYEDALEVEVFPRCGIVHLYTVDDLFYVCYPDLEGEDELPEEAVFHNTYCESESESEEDDIMESIRMLTIANDISEQEHLLHMVNYHLQFIGEHITDDVCSCKRFDIESLLIDYDRYMFQEFKQKFMNYISNRLQMVCDSKRAFDMENDLSQLFFETVSTNVVVSDRAIWYYDDIIWRRSNSFGFLWNLLSNDFIRYLEKEPSLSSAAIYLNSVAARKRILEDTRYKLEYPDFESKIDANKTIIGVKNGTLHILDKKLNPSKVSDLISKNTGTDYIPYSMESREVCMLLNVLKKIFPYEDLLRFFIRSCSTFLEGENSKKVFYVWWGTGNNCKTGMATLIQNTFGDYCGTAPVSLITSKRNGSSEATPELCHIEGKLVVFLQEPNPKEKMKTGRIKELTGNDKIFVRNLFQQGREMEVKCKIIHVCNFPTASPDTDIAFKRRMVVIKFPSTFLDDAEYNRQKARGIRTKNTFRIREGMDDVLRSMGSIFLSILVREYAIFKEVGLQIPEIVKQNTEEFLTYGNQSLKFIRKHLRHTKGDDHHINIHIVYEMFKNWFRNMYPSYNIPNNETFVRELNNEGFLEDEDGIIHDITTFDIDSNITI